MRLWHYELIHYLPDSQLLAQWRELNSIYKKQDRHILINYIYEYDKAHLYAYSKLVIKEMKERGFKINSFENFEKYFNTTYNGYDMLEDERLAIKEIFPLHHTQRYMMQCFYNLQEKYDRGQRDFTRKLYVKICSVVCGGSIE